MVSVILYLTIKFIPVVNLMILIKKKAKLQQFMVLLKCNKVIMEFISRFCVHNCIRSAVDKIIAYGKDEMETHRIKICLYPSAVRDYPMINAIYYNIQVKQVFVYLCQKFIFETS